MKFKSMQDIRKLHEELARAAEKELTAWLSEKLASNEAASRAREEQISEHQQRLDDLVSEKTRTIQRYDEEIARHREAIARLKEEVKPRRRARPPDSPEKPARAPRKQARRTSDDKGRR